MPTVSNYELAEWVRTNLTYDQLILECYTKGKPSSGWVHVSYVGAGDRFDVSTYSGGQFTDGLVAWPKLRCLNAHSQSRFAVVWRGFAFV